MATLRDEELQATHLALVTWSQEIQGGLPGPARSSMGGDGGVMTATPAMSTQSESIDSFICHAHMKTQIMLRSYYQRSLPMDAIAIRLGLSTSSAWVCLKCCQSEVRGWLRARGFRI